MRRAASAILAYVYFASASEAQARATKAVVPTLIAIMTACNA